MPRPMSRAAVALLLLLLAPLLAGAAEAQPAGFTIPTQKDTVVGGLNVTTWIMRDTRTIAYTPDIRTNPLGYLWNLNFTAGSLGVFYVKGVATQPDSYVFEATLSSPSPLFTVLGPATNASGAGVPQGACVPQGATARCSMSAERSEADATFQFFLAGSAEPGSLQIAMNLRTFRNGTGTPVLEDERNVTYELRILDLIPPFATRAQVGDSTTVGAWANGGPLGVTGGGCLAGSGVAYTENISIGAPGVICFVAINRSPNDHRVTARLIGDPWLLAPPNPWVSQPFNASSGGHEAPVNGFVFHVDATKSTLGAAQARIEYTVERDENGTWVPVGEGQLAVPMNLIIANVIIRNPQATVNWLAHAPLLIGAVAGLGYMAYQNRKPTLQPRSQALREAGRKSKPRDPDSPKAQAALAAEVEHQRQEVQEAGWEKKRKILDAKRDDIISSIRIAEERHQRGEITEHVVKGIRERKERQLEQVQKEMDELQG